MYPRVVRAARAMLGMSQEELAQISMISWTTLNLFEREHKKLSGRTCRAIVRSLEDRGIVFVIDDTNKIGIYTQDAENKFTKPA